MTKREAIAWLQKHHACEKSMRRMRKCASLKQMLQKATVSERVWAVYNIGGKLLAKYRREREPYFHLYGDEYNNVRGAIADRLLRAWLAAR